MLEILKYCLPAIIVLGTTWVVIAKMLRNEEQKRNWELKKHTQKEITQIKLRAYERLVLLLERTQPEYMLTHIAPIELTQKTIPELQQELLKTVRMEFDHNLSQQIYISDEVWDKVILARDEMGAFINAMSMQLPPNSSTLDYAKILMTAYNSNGDTPHALAMAALKDEARRELE